MAHGIGALKGLRVTLGVLLTKPITIEYPFKKVKFSPVYRGGFAFHPDRCNACKSCQTSCPNKVITVTGERGEDKKMRLVRYEMDLNYCLYCGFCVDACNKDAITMTDQIDLAAYERGFLSMELFKGPSIGPAGGSGAGGGKTAKDAGAPAKTGGSTAEEGQGKVSR
ncbi:MAG: 4Fe-4S dicluster domain-containing protein [Bacillota bacterium]